MLLKLAVQQSTEEASRVPKASMLPLYTKTTQYSVTFLLLHEITILDSSTMLLLPKHQYNKEHQQFK